MSSGDGIDSTLEYMLSGARGSCGYVPSYHAPRLPLPEALGPTMLIHCWKPSNVFDRRPGSCPGSRRETGRSDMWQNPACPCLSYGGKVKAWITPGIGSF
jgi:hypothetical protein